MAVRIKFDNENNVIDPVLVLMNRNANRIGTIPYYSFKAKINLNSYSELSFVVDQDSCSNDIWNNLVDFKLVWVRDWNLCFEIYVDTSEDDSTKKTITANSLGESELSQINLYNIEINTETDIDRDDYVPTVLYNNENHNASLLHRIMEKCPHYTIGHVDSTIANIQRTFSFNSQSIYDSFNKIAEEIGCMFRLNCSLSSNGNLVREINVYDLERTCLSCGYRDDSNYAVCPKCGSTNISEGYGEDTTIFVSSRNLAEQINFTTDTGSVKNCFRLVAGDDLMTSAIISCNPNGGQYLWYISQEMRDDMPSALVNKIDQYLALCEYYKNEYSVSISSSQVNDYNTLIEKYSAYTDRFNSITTPIIGSSSLMENLYNVLDFNIYLKNEMMPTPQMSNTSAADQAAKLTVANLSPVSVTELSSLSLATANNAVLGMAKVIIDNRYKISIVNSTLSNNTWQGSFNVTSYSNEEDTATSNTINVVINDNYENFLKQKIDKALDKSMTTDDPIDIVALFKLSLTNFKKEIKKYSLSILKSFYDNCETCLDVLIEQGVANSETWAGKTPNLYNTLYVPYRNKLTALEQETKLRETEINKVEKIKNVLIQNENTIQSNLDLSSYLGETLWKQFVAYRREDTYRNDNYISDGLSNTELFEKANAFINEAQKNIYKSANLQHSISTTLKNLLMMKEFESIVDYFEVGNWIRVKVDGDIYKLRLISYEISLKSFDTNNISVEFSDVVKVSDGISDIQKILSQSKSISSSYGSVKRQAKAGNEGNKKVDKWINDGLSLNNIKILEDAENQNIKFDNNGILCREYLPLIDEYSDQQLKIINKGIYLTDDKWNTAKVGIGEIEYNGNKYYGVNGEALIGNIIIGNELHIVNSQGQDILTVVDGHIDTKISDNNTVYVDNHIAGAITTAEAYTNSQVTQTANSITSEVSKKVRATVGYDDENLIDFSVMTQTSGSGITFTVDDKGVVTATGTATKDAYCNFTLPNSVYGNFYLTGCPNGGKEGSTSKYLIYIRDDTTGTTVKKHDGTTTSDYLRNEDESTEVQLVQGHTNRVRILIYSGTTVSNLQFIPCVSKHRKITTELSETNSRITQTAESVTIAVSDTLNTVASSDAVEYKMPAGVTIDYYGFGLKNSSTTDTGVSAVGNNNKYYLDRKTGKLYKSNNSTWVLNQTLTPKFNDYYTSSQTDAEIKVTSEGIKQTVGSATSKYDTTGYTIHYYGLDEDPEDAGYPASDYNGKYYLNQSTGFVYKSNGNSWSKQNSTALPLISTQLDTKIDVTAEGIKQTVGKGVTEYDKENYTISFYGYGFKEASAPYYTTDTGKNASASGANGKYFLNQTDGGLYLASGGEWTYVKTLTAKTEVLGSQIVQTADSITSSVSKKIRANVGYYDDNLLDIASKNTTTTNGITFTVDKETYSVTANGKATANAYFNISVPVVGNYYLSGGADGGGTDSDRKYLVYGYDATTGARVKKHDGTTQSDLLFDGTSGTEVKYVEGHDNRVRILVYLGQEVNNVVFSPALTEHKKLNTAMSETNSRITQTADSIRLEVSAEIDDAKSVPAQTLADEFIIPTLPSGSTLFYGFGLKDSSRTTDTGKKASDNVGAYFLNCNTGVLYKAGSTTWAKDTNISPNPLTRKYSTTTQMNSAIDQKADSIELSVSKKVRATVGYDDENLIDFEASSTIIQYGITYTVDKDTDIVTADGTASADGYIDIPIPSTVYGDYYLTGCPDGGKVDNSSKYMIYARDMTASAAVKKHDGTTIAPYLYNEDESTEIKLVEGHRNVVRIFIYGGTEVNNLQFTPCVSKHQKITTELSDTNSRITQTDSQIRFYVANTYSTKTETTNAKDEAISTAAGDATAKADSARGAAAKGSSKYNTTGKTIHYYGYGFKETSTPYKTTDTGISAATANNYFLNQTNGKLYKSDGSDWVEQETLALILDDYSTTTQMNSAIDVKANGITLASAQLAYGQRTKNLIPFVLKSNSKSSSSGGTTCTRSDTGYKLTNNPSSNVVFVLYTTNSSNAWDNPKLPSNMTLPVGRYIVSGTGFSSDIQYRIQYSTDGSTATQVAYYSGGDEITFDIPSTAKYVRHYIWVKSGTDLGSGVTVRPMIRDATITDSTYSPGIDAGAYMCSSINLTPEKLELDAGKLIINAGNFQLDSNGTVTITSGVIKTSNYEAGSDSTKTVGGMINLAATSGNDYLFDTADFKITGNGNLQISGGSVVIERDTESSRDSYMLLKSKYVASDNNAYSFRMNISPYQTTHQYTKYVGNTSTIDVRDVIYLGNNGNITLLNDQGLATKPKTVIGTDSISVLDTEGTNKPHSHMTPLGFSSYDNSSSSSPYTYISGSYISTQNVSSTNITGTNITSTNMYTNVLSRSSGNIAVRTCLAFTNEQGIVLGTNEVAFRMFEGEVAVGSDTRPIRIYATAAYTPTAWVVPSDARRKHDVESLDNRYLDVIKSIEPKRFRYLNNPLDRYHTGYIAQDVKTAMDKLNVSVDELSAFVDINGDGSDLALRYGEMIPLLHKWLKELDSRITAIEKRKE